MEQRYQQNLANNMPLQNNSHQDQPMEVNQGNPQEQQAEQQACENYNDSVVENETRSDLGPNTESRNIDLDQAADDLTMMIKTMAKTSQTLKKIKFESLSTLVSLYSKIDIPLLVMDTLEKEMFETLPRVENI